MKSLCCQRESDFGVKISNHFRCDVDSESIINHMRLILISNRFRNDSTHHCIYTEVV